ncbi:MAG: hypothetical protein OSJ69_17035 [Acetatifactor sp.]|nr:hypothetical protein [Acetatifactor sp.]
MSMERSGMTGSFFKGVTLAYARGGDGVRPSALHKIIVALYKKILYNLDITKIIYKNQNRYAHTI